MSTRDPAKASLPRTDEGLRICQVVKVKPECLDEYKKVGLQLKNHTDRSSGTRCCMARSPRRPAQITHCRYVDRSPRDLTTSGKITQYTFSRQ